MFYDFTKRAIDFILVCIGLFFGLPLMAIIAVAIKLDSKGPSIFRQERVTKGGKSFYMYKFRSMILNAEQLLYNDPQLLSEYESGSYKIKKDPRITKVGNIIRKTSLDELPQFWNVLMGEMSFVGPRAYRPIELKKQQMVYPESKPFVKALLTVKPGITGPWQVGGRSNINFDQRVKMDAYYAQRRSLLYDLWIILKTPIAVIHREGAS